MRIVIVSQWFPPEQAPIGYMLKELAEALVERGHEVQVITGFPNHPSGVVFGGYRKRWSLKEALGKVQVQRMYLYTRPQPGKLSRALAFLTFTISSACALLIQRRVDLIFAVFQPLSVGLTLPLLSRIKGSKLVLNVQDLHPDVPIELGLIRQPWLIEFLRWVERLGYRKSDGLAVICDSFKRHCVDRGARADNVAVIPNWIDTETVRPGNRQNPFREELGLTAEDVVVLYAGTIGLVSGAEVVLQAARRLATAVPSVRFVFVGEGPELPALREQAARWQLSNVLFAPFQPRARLSEVQAMADISLVTLRKGKGRTSVPSKVLGYMAAGRPVLASVDSDSETASLVSASGCGEVVAPEDAEILANAVSKLAASDERRGWLGSNGRLYLEAHYQKTAVTARYVEFLERMKGGA